MVNLVFLHFPTTKHCNFKFRKIDPPYYTVPACLMLIIGPGYGNFAAVTFAGRLFCLLFGIIGIPFMLSGQGIEEDRRKGKGRRCCLGEESIHFLAALAIWPRTILNNRKHCTKIIWEKKDDFILFFKIVLGKTASAAYNWINSSPQTEATTFAFALLSAQDFLIFCGNTQSL